MNIDPWITGEGALIAACLTEILKRALRLPSDVEDRALPVLALATGILWQALALRYVNAPDQRWEAILVGGIISGLVASGVWAQVSSLIRGIRAPGGDVTARG